MATAAAERGRHAPKTRLVTRVNLLIYKFLRAPMGTTLAKNATLGTRNHIDLQIITRAKENKKNIFFFQNLAQISTMSA